MANFLPYGRQHISEDDIAAVVDVLRSDYLTTGPVVPQFEEALARRIGSEACLVVNSGTAALHLAVLAAGGGVGDVAIVPSVTFLATANAVRMAGAEVVFADVDPLTGLMTSATFLDAFARAEAKYNQGCVKAVLPVHLNGALVDMAALAPLCRQRGIVIIADCCHALGATFEDGSQPGSGRYEDFACFSMHPVKSIAMGEGGAVTCADGEALKTMALLRSHGMTRNRAEWQKPESFLSENLASAGEPLPWYYEMQTLGYNYRAPDILCALGLSQLKKLDGFLSQRRMLAAHYDACLQDNFPLGSAQDGGPVVRPVWLASSGGMQSAYHLYAVHIDFKAAGSTRADVAAKLRGKGIGTQVHYIPVHTQPYYEARYGSERLAGAEYYYSQALSLPLYVDMGKDDVERVVAGLKEALAGHKVPHSP